MDNGKRKNDAITARGEDFTKWYTDVCRKAELMDYSVAKGFIDYLPYGFAIWEEIRNYLDRRFKANGASNVYLPLVIPESLFNKEKEHVEGFAPETLVATYGGGEELSDPLIIRPTSEVLFSNLYKRLVKSYRDLPKIYNQWCSVVRWEKTTRPFLRGAEFLWQEGHCLFETEEEARKNAEDILREYETLGRDILAIPFLTGFKSTSEKFAGAVSTYAIEALMPDGKALQCGTTHYLGQGFARAFGISYLGRGNKLEAPHQTSWGVSTRLIGAIIMVHGDDNGLVLPPMVAPVQVVIVPIKPNDGALMEAVAEIEEGLKKAGIRVKVDADTTKSPGWKFAEYEMKGVPLRIEIGPRDLSEGKAVIVRRVSEEKESMALKDVVSLVPSLLRDIHAAMLKKATDFLASRIVDADGLDSLKKALDEGYVARMLHDDDPDTEAYIKEKTGGGTCRAIPFEQESMEGKVSPVSGKPAKYLAYFAKAY